MPFSLCFEKVGKLPPNIVLDDGKWGGSLVVLVKEEVKKKGLLDF